ncbi:hypothetical protein AJ80_08234 [Polytolypa hystricis UAMH7299]|uniref:Histone transcription regulator 3 homolog n=1 Tax=Polytolypa hystricis (strain UAMH7299) TaxID=1447883 RepID=A0A2B7XAD9_POLH7|nr:hypothetical protein AJ80_08234 [Polytolypa hystricis UAMH7299]
MSAFAALNLEPDEATEEEVDDTKEIQIEEALKLYQNALKLHSQGPQYYEQAKEAYELLFKSEIFKYPEAISVYKRSQQDDLDIEDLDAVEEAAADSVLDSSDTASSALPQTIYLSYKNHGQFLLDTLKHSMQAASKSGNLVDKTLNDVSNPASSAIRDFADALERDESDIELWRKSARIGDALHSNRLARFCLESVMDGDGGDAADERFDQPGLEQAFAVEDLRELLRILDDKLSLSQVPLKRPRKALFELLRRRADPFPYLPNRLDNLEIAATPRSTLGIPPTRHTITPTTKTWSSTGKAILEVLMEEKRGDAQFLAGSAIGIALPGDGELVDGTSPALPIIQRKDLSPNEPESKEIKDLEMSNTETHHVNTDATDTCGSPKASVAEVANENEDHAAAQLTNDEDVLPDNPPRISTAAAEEEEVNKSQPASPDIETRTSAVSRKRSSASINNEEPQDGGRTKSRRLRARESNAETLVQPEEVEVDLSKYYEDRLEHFVHADQWMFGTVNALLSKVGVEDLGTIDELHSTARPQRTPGAYDYASQVYLAESALFQNFRETLGSWSDEKAQATTQSDTLSIQQNEMARTSGFKIFSDHSRQRGGTVGQAAPLPDDEGLSTFLQSINDGWLCRHEVAFRFLDYHLKPRDYDDSTTYTRYTSGSIYATQPWSAVMKEAILQLIAEDDEFIYKNLKESILSLERSMLTQGFKGAEVFTSEYLTSMELVQSIYELHLDVYASMNGPSTDIDRDPKILQHDRLSRWSSLSRAFINHHLDLCDDDNVQTIAALRHMWSCVFHSSLTEDASRDYVFGCLEDLKRVLTSLGNPIIMLANSSTMPEISVAAADQEISRLKSMDFFSKIFSSESDNPVDLIEAIEPILEPSSIEYIHASPTTSATEERSESAEQLKGNLVSSHIQDMVAFLDRGDATLRLFLWQKLRAAYESIDYPTKVVSCYLRSIEVIVKELLGSTSSEGSSDHRQLTLLKWLRTIDTLLSKVLPKVMDDPEAAFECFDMNHLQASMSAVARVSRLLHCFSVLEDSIGVGQTPPPARPVALAKSFDQFKERLRSMQVKGWVLQYTLLREGINQNKELFDTPFDDRINFLRSVHNALGLRKICKYSNKVLLQLMKTELLTLPTEDNYEADVAQVLYDLYALRFTQLLDPPVDHGCTAKRLDSNTAATIIDFILTQANRMNIKDLAKSELKSTISAVQMAIEWTKSPMQTFNKRVISSSLKSPINPTHLFRAVQGVGEVSIVPLQTESAKIVNKGWLFLLGMIALAKFRLQSQKRVTTIPTDNLDLAATFLRQDLEYGTENWESWYRLAQVYDLKLEEDIAWSADKLNNNRAVLVTLQRKAIHAYSMAVAAAIRTANLSSSETRMTLSELYTDFGFRIYASTREPLSMEAFSLDEFSRHFSSGESQQMYKAKPFQEMSTYSAWNFASFLFRQAMVDRPEHWLNHYMLSKCLWKMFTHGDEKKENHAPVEVDDILDSLADAIDALPKKKDSRSEPILEPHYRLVSMVHKLVHRGNLTPQEGYERLSYTPWARKVSPPDGIDSWKPYILEVLKNIGNADKSNWHHRIVARAAHILYDGAKDNAAAAAAKAELSHQIFTKTMTLQVWRPEHERAGRHFVYTTRYVYFFVKLLDQLDDRANLDMLLRRVRRKATDYVNHTKLWEDICVTYIKLFRRVAKIPEGHEEVVFKPVTLDEFLSYSTRLDGLCQNPSPELTALMDLLRDAVELKRLNSTLMKPAIFEDLIADTYAVMYQSNMSKLVEQATEEESRERMKVDHLLMASDRGESTPGPSNTAPQGTTTGPKPRTKGVSKKELQRKVDAIVAKSIASRPAVKPARLVDDEPQPPPSTMIEVAVPAPSAAMISSEETKDEAKEITSKEEPVSVVQSSAPGSMHDSADDESELSEIDEEKESDGLEPEPEAEAEAEVEAGPGHGHHHQHDEPELAAKVATTTLATSPSSAPQPTFPNLLIRRVLSPKPEPSEMSTNVSVDDGGDVDSAPAPSVLDSKSERTEAVPTDGEKE